MEKPDHKKSDGHHFPWDLRALLEPWLLMILLCLLAPYFSLARSRGDKTLMTVALVLGGIGVVLLFFARLPLYRQRRFLVFGPRQLNGIYRKLYFLAYLFIVPCILLLLALIVF